MKFDESIVDKQNMVSIVVPVYNTEKYLKECIESILTQSYKNIQLILIDDGSTDNSSCICDEYAKKDNRIICIHKENGGISSARNVGLEKISGDFVCFIDSDDFIENDFIETLVKNIKNYNVVAVGNKTVDSNGNVLNIIRPKADEFLSNDDIKMAYMAGTIKHLFYGPVGKLYKSDLLKDIKFNTDLVVGEDIVFNLNFLKVSSTVKVINYSGYVIRKNIESTTHKIALKYTPLYEYGYDVIINALKEAKEEWGLDNSYLEKEEARRAVIRYYNIVTNLLRPHTPYNAKEIRFKIKNIHNDKQFMQKIQKQKFKSLSRTEKIAYISVKIKNSFFTYFIFKTVLKLLKEI